MLSGLPSLDTYDNVPPYDALDDHPANLVANLLDGLSLLFDEEECEALDFLYSVDSPHRSEEPDHYDWWEMVSEYS